MKQGVVYDVIVIGSGPAGLSCAISAQQAGLTSLVLDKGSLCDSIRRFPTDMTFFSTPELLELSDVPFVCSSVRPSRRDVLNYYRQVVERKKLDLQLYTTVERVEKSSSAQFTVRTSRGDLRARVVIIATGYFDTTNTLDVPGENSLHVHRYYQEPFTYGGTHVVVVGGRNSAVETALDLWRHGAHVHLVHRGPGLAESVKYWQRPDMENRIKSGEIAVSFDSRITHIWESELEIEHVHSHERKIIQADFVIPHIGYRPDVELLKRCGLTYDKETLIPTINTETHESNIPGLYFAGSVLCGAKVWNIFIENGREHAKPIVEHITQKSLS